MVKLFFIGITAFSTLLHSVVAQQCGPGMSSCSGNNCCSRYGWCGTSAAYCGTGCQSGFGICAAGNPSSSTSTSTSTTSPPTKPVSTNGQCQTNGAICPSGQCCSQYGWCGTSSAYCGTGCQLAWGVCSNASPQPSTTSTSSTTTIASTPTSTPSGNIRVITQCTVPGTVAITFDDGPYMYTSNIVQQFNAAGGKVTFFMNGLNYGCIYNQAAAVKQAFDSGHQIGSHTWSHADLAQLSSSQISTEMSRLSAAFRKIIGADPVYMRPPYGSYSQSTVTTLQNLGYKVLAMWSIDSGDSTGLSTVQQQQRYNSASTSIPHNVLQHETLRSTADTMVPFIINWAKSRNLRMVTLGTCLGDPESNWYRNRVVPESQNPSWVC